MHNMTVLPCLFNYHSHESSSENGEEYITEKLIKGSLIITFLIIITYQNVLN